MIKLKELLSEDYSQRAGINFYYKVKSPNKNIVLDVVNTERILLNLFSIMCYFFQIARAPVPFPTP